MSDGYPDLDLSDSLHEENEAPKIGAIVGAPPSSDFESEEDEIASVCTDYAEENEMFDRGFNNNSDEYDSGEDAFDADAYLDLQEEFQNRIILPELSPLDIGNEDSVGSGIFQMDSATEELFATALTSAMMAGVEFLKDGFEPQEINKCLRDIDYSLLFITKAYLGPDFDKLPNRSDTEFCHALANNGWLEFRDGKFFPVLDGSNRRHVTALIDGSSQLKHSVESRKLKAEKYESEEQEIRVMRTFNMIAELLHAVREEQMRQKVRFSCLNNAYSSMVNGEKYKDIHKKYATVLKLDPSENWNPAWFNKYTKRSSLQKFVQMSKYSEIVFQPIPQPPVLYFRADNEGDRPVVMFTDEHIRDVKDKWRSGNQNCTNFGKNYGGGGRGERRDYRSRPQQQKKQIEQDPNYKSSKLDGGITSTMDDGSLEPSTSERYNRERSPPRPLRTRSPPAREERASIEQEIESNPESEKSNPPAVPARPDPFSGRPIQNIDNSTRDNGRGLNDRDNRGNTGTHGGFGRSFQRDVRRITDIGDTSSDGDITSEGSYSEDDEETKEAIRVSRIEKNKRRDEREIARRKKHEEENKRQQAVKPKSRFNHYNQPRARSSSPESEEETARVEPQSSSQRDRVANETAEAQPPAAPQQPAASRQPTAPQPPAAPRHPPVEIDSSDDDSPPAPGTVSTQIAPLTFSNTKHNIDPNFQIPYHPFDVTKSKGAKEKQRVQEQLADVRREEPRQTSQHPYVVPPPANRPSSRENQFGDPVPSNGFGNVKSFGNTPFDREAPPPPHQPSNDQYRGKNMTRNPQPVHPAQQNSQQYSHSQQPVQYPPQQQYQHAPAQYANQHAPQQHYQHQQAPQQYQTHHEPQQFYQPPQQRAPVQQQDSYPNDSHLRQNSRGSNRPMDHYEYDNHQQYQRNQPPMSNQHRDSYQSNGDEMNYRNTPRHQPMQGYHDNRRFDSYPTNGQGMNQSRMSPVESSQHMYRAPNYNTHDTYSSQQQNFYPPSHQPRFNSQQPSSSNNNGAYNPWTSQASQCPDRPGFDEDDDRRRRYREHDSASVFRQEPSSSSPRTHLPLEIRQSNAIMSLMYDYNGNMKLKLLDNLIEEKPEIFSLAFDLRKFITRFMNDKLAIYGPSGQESVRML